MAQSVRRRGQGMDLTPEQVAAERARARMAAGVRGVSIFEVVWSPEETEALRAALVGKEVAA